MQIPERATVDRISGAAEPLTVVDVTGPGVVIGSAYFFSDRKPSHYERFLKPLLDRVVAALLLVITGPIALVAAAAFLAHFTLAFVSSLNESLWQGQTPLEVQGRVFAFKQSVMKAAVLLAYIAAGCLADRVIDPLLQPGGRFVGTLGGWIGVGPGRGLAALFILIGLVKVLAAAWLGFSSRSGEVEGQLTRSSHPVARHSELL